MRSLILLGFIIVLISPVIAQKSKTVLGYTRFGDRINLFAKVDAANCDDDWNYLEFPDAKTYFIIGDSACANNEKRWFMVLFSEKIRFVPKYQFNEFQKIDSLLVELIISAPTLKERLEYAKMEFKKLESEKKIEEEKQSLIEQERQKKETDSIIREYEKSLSFARTKNIIIQNWSWSYPNEYSSVTDVNITVFNPYKSKIKYVWFTIQAFNDVDDLVRDGVTGKTEKTVQGIGPIEYGSIESYNFESVYYSKVIATMKLKQIKIQFFNGSTRVINNPIGIHREESDEK